MECFAAKVNMARMLAVEATLDPMTVSLPEINDMGESGRASGLMVNGNSCAPGVKIGR